MFKNELLELHQKIEGFSIEYWIKEVKKKLIL